MRYFKSCDEKTGSFRESNPIKKRVFDIKMIKDNLLLTDSSFILHFFYHAYDETVPTLYQAN